ncbi:uncharacterized protein B0I36DRAFT_247269 [Microdochium trichocladiopsis]|uniref:FAD-binding domain-containing protein n=1 Tax=Microdochium trichocladiopsis TaxID=1682393 RepID=A0A9P9BRE8_9PEZI|nr:uncharacterized protein B0I36DRAFT_247269 [Microdochium trichocladiopsis]KAH7027220.1 hypothetical protein B0I36DRAFT_247269 [Microdochium trichocladiopsis]
MRILVNGAGVCGPAFACFLLHSSLDCAITIVERSPELRTGGQQIDLRDQGIPVMSRLGLLEVVKQRTVPETGLVFVNDKGQRLGVFGVNDSGKGPQSFVSEYEIMRGDLVQVLYDESLKLAAAFKESGKRSLRYEYGKYATDIQQDNDVAHVVFSDGSRGEYDLVVGADGQGSKTRRIMFGEEAGAKMFESRDLFIGLWTQPKSESDKQHKEALVMPTLGRRLLTIRTGAESGTQSLYAIMGKTQFLRDVQKNQSVEEQKRTWAALFQDCGWESKRMNEGLMAADDYYMSEIGQVKCSSWSKGRSVLLGDAGYCPGPITGLGTTCSLMGAYTLAGALAENPGDFEAAFARYEKDLRPFVNGAQTLPPGIPGILYPSTRFGIACLQWAVWTIALLKIDRFFAFFAPSAKKEYEVPEYPALNLPAVQTSA